ncbi:MAG: bifunctional hydroxymethylpyrimidine kinase/phosphomethylpyrimidine kinase [Alphaproteobacteria bacterium]
MPRVLTIAGSDSGAGAGIQADIKTVMALGGYCQTAITALTAQDTRGVGAVQPVPASFIRRQIHMAFDDIGVDAVKTGMLHSVEVIETVAQALSQRSGVPVVVDPVMVAKGGARLLDRDAVNALLSALLPLTSLLTPNVPEAESLAGMSIHDTADMARAAESLKKRGAGAVLVKGGHMPGQQVVDLLLWSGGVTRFADARIASRNTHGTGCTLAAAIACGLAAGIPLDKAVARARAFVRQAIIRAPGLGHGQGPLGHAAAQCSDTADG